MKSELERRRVDDEFERVWQEAASSYATYLDLARVADLASSQSGRLAPDELARSWNQPLTIVVHGDGEHAFVE